MSNPNFERACAVMNEMECCLRDMEDADSTSMFHHHLCMYNRFNILLQGVQIGHVEALDEVDYFIKTGKLYDDDEPYARRW